MIIYILALLLIAVAIADADDYFRKKQCDDFYYCSYGYCCKEGWIWMCCQYSWQGDTSTGGTFIRWTTLHSTTTTLRSTTTRRTTTTTEYSTKPPRWVWAIVGSVIFVLFLASIILRICLSRKRRTSQTHRQEMPRTHNPRANVNRSRSKAQPGIFTVDVPSYNSQLRPASATVRTDDVIPSAPTASNWWELEETPRPGGPPPDPQEPPLYPLGPPSEPLGPPPAYETLQQ